MKKVSVIIPIYNGEKYIDRIIHNIKNQTYPNIEIICINNNSTDNTKEILKQYQDILVLEEDNSGVSYARNKGLNYASGDYISFIDVDDEIDQTFYQKMIESIETNQTDIAFCDVHKIYDDTLEETFEISYPQAGIVENHLYLREGLNNAYVTNKVYKKEIWKTQRFPIMIYEDIDIILNMQESLKISYVNEYLYHYHKHQSSITGNLDPIKAKDIIQAFKDCIEHASFIYLNDISYNIYKRMKRYRKDKHFSCIHHDLDIFYQEYLPIFMNNPYIKN